MLSPPSHTWTQLQKWLILGGVAVGLVASGVLIYSYERYYRGPDESALFGTWADADPMWNGTVYYRLNPDHTFQFMGDFADEETAFLRGTWYAGGKMIYLKLQWEEALGRKFIYWRIEDLSSKELRVRYSRGGRVYSYSRVGCLAQRI